MTLRFIDKDALVHEVEEYAPPIFVDSVAVNITKRTVCGIYRMSNNNIQQSRKQVTCLKCLANV